VNNLYLFYIFVNLVNNANSVSDDEPAKVKPTPLTAEQLIELIQRINPQNAASVSFSF
jgi:hypothetical protein